MVRRRRTYANLVSDLGKGAGRCDAVEGMKGAGQTVRSFHFTIEWW
jgi:hypothetical protein